MQIIQPASDSTMKVLGKPRQSKADYRLMRYVLAQKVETGFLLFHELTRELLLLTDAEYAELRALPALREKWFCVPEELNDRAYADQVRFVYQSMWKKPAHFTGYTIFTTTDCNARCFYCYEKGRSRVPMSRETAHRTASYIAAHCGGEPVKLHWFGGEPLFNREVIDVICGDLASAGVSYRSSMTTNAYLFDDDTVRQAVECWKLGKTQVTLDGTEAIYNRSKAFIYQNGPSPYQVVMDNMERLLDAGIRVSVRLNLDKHNADDLFLLADELHARFAGKQGLSVYSQILFENAGPETQTRTAEDRRFLLRKQQALRERLREYALAARHTLKKQIPVNRCMADSGASLTVLPDGSLGLCEHYTEDHFVGHIGQQEEPDAAAVRACHTLETYEACAACFRYPECIRLSICQSILACNPEMRESKRLETVDSMKDTYAAWLRNETGSETESPEDC